MAGMALFRSHEIATRFFIQRDLTEGQRATLEKKIVNHGGEVVEEEDDDPDCILVKDALLPEYRRRYQHSQRVYIEHLSFINKCIERGEYYHNKPIKKGLGGRRPGSFRTEYTASDDEHLAEYLAIKIPDEAAGGRTGNGVYKLLVESLETFPWADRHTWESWRNRYKKNRDHINKEIDTYIKRYPPHPDGKGEYPLDRRHVAYSRTIRRNVGEEGGEDKDEEDGEGEGEGQGQGQGQKDEMGSGGIDHDTEGIDHDYDFEMEHELMNIEPDRMRSKDISPAIEEDENDGPAATQATLVGDAIQMKTRNNLRSTNETTPVRAARNRERSRMEKERAKANKVPPTDTQATAVEVLLETHIASSPQQVPATVSQVPTQSTSQRTRNTVRAARKTTSQPTYPVPSLPGPSQTTRRTRNQGTTKEPSTIQTKADPPSIEEMRKVFQESEPERTPEQTQPAAKASDAPFRNTRARSRSVSVEPQLPPKKRVKREPVILNTVAEEVEDAVSDGEVATYQEEENSLEAVEDVLGGDILDGESRDLPRKLGQRKVQVLTSESEDEEDEDEDDLAIRADANRVNKLDLHTAATTSSPVGPDLSNSRFPSVLPASSPFSRQPTSTPIRIQSGRKGAAGSRPSWGTASKIKKANDEYSESDFPATGTQARREKARRTDRLKRTPYEPPAVTKAAELVRNKLSSRR